MVSRPNYRLEPCQQWVLEEAWMGTESLRGQAASAEPEGGKQLLRGMQRGAAGLLQS